MNGVTRVDFWTRGGEAHAYVLADAAASVDSVVAACLGAAGVRLPPAESEKH